MSRSVRAKAAFAALALAGCSAGQRGSELTRPEPVFDVRSFFVGRTHGDGRLKILFKSAQLVRVEGSGRIEPDGTLVLDQQVARSGQAPKGRQWRIRPIGGGHYAGTLTDATAPIDAEVRGNLLHLRFPMKGGLDAEQWIYLQPDGRTALNRMAISKFGFTIARLDETIRKLD